MAKTETELTELKINYLSQEQFDAELAAGRIQSNELYMTPSQTIPTALSELTDDATHRTVTDTEKSTWNGKLATNGSGNNLTVSFTQASSRTNIATGGTIATAFSRIAKFFADLKTVAFTGAYSDLTGTPTNVSSFTNDAGYLTTEQYTGTYSKPSGGIPKTDLASAVQTSLGRADTALQSFTETDPTVPNWAKAESKPSYALSELTEDATHRSVTDSEKSAWNAKSDFTGSYNDLEDKPTIPTVPTNVSAFTNDAGYLTEHQSLDSYVKYTDYATTDRAGVIKRGNWITLSSDGKLQAGELTKAQYDSATGVTFVGKTTLNNVLSAVIPTNVSALTNDAGYLTSEQYTGTVKSVNGTSPDANGNVAITITTDDATESASGLMSASDKAKLDKVTYVLGSDSTGIYIEEL